MKKGMKRNEHRRNRTRGRLALISAAIGVMVFGTIAFAGEKESEGDYGGFYLRCTSICEAKYGIAKTLGTTKPYYNYAAVVIYGQDGNSQGTTYGTGGPVSNDEASATAVARMNGNDLLKAVTYHASQTASGSFTDGFLRQLVYTEYR